MPSVTGRRSPREREKSLPDSAVRGARFRAAWKNNMAISQNTTISVTFFPEVMKVGQDVMTGAAMSREILAFEGQKREAGAFSSFQKEQTGTVCSRVSAVRSLPVRRTMPGVPVGPNRGVRFCRSSSGAELRLFWLEDPRNYRVQGLGGQPSARALCRARHRYCRSDCI